LEIEVLLDPKEKREIQVLKVFKETRDLPT
jgi:hypothetical protein